MSCTNTGPFDGGTWNNAVIVNPEITGGTIANSTLTNVSLTGVITMDDAAVSSILGAICDDVSECVVNVSSDVPASSVAAAGDNVLPTTIVGTDRSQLLGKPTTYLKLGNYLVPAYTAE